MSRPASGIYLKVKKSPRAAIAASLVVPGAGQFYNREVLKGCLLFLVAAGFALWTLSNLHTRDLVELRALERSGSAAHAARAAREAVPWPLAPLAGTALAALYSAWDGHRVAQRILDMVEVRRNAASPTRSFDIPKELDGHAIPRRRPTDRDT